MLIGIISDKPHQAEALIMSSVAMNCECSISLVLTPLLPPQVTSNAVKRLDSTKPVKLGKKIEIYCAYLCFKFSSLK